MGNRNTFRDIFLLFFLTSLMVLVIILIFKLSKTQNNELTFDEIYIKKYKDLNLALELMMFDRNCSSNIRCTGILGINNIDTRNDFLATRISKFLSAEKFCKSPGHKQGCWPNEYYHYFNNDKYKNFETTPSNMSVFKNSSGMIYAVQTNNDHKCLKSNINVARIFLDINGEDAPNILGKDLYIFTVDCNGRVYPLHYNKNKNFISKECSFEGKGESCGTKILRFSDLTN